MPRKKEFVETMKGNLESFYVEMNEEKFEKFEVFNVKSRPS